MTNDSDQDKIAQTKLNGSYLITHRKHVFSDDTEIFILLNINDRLCGICVNMHLKKDNGQNLSLLDLKAVIEETGLTIRNQDFAANIPILNGGRNKERSMYALYTLPLQVRTNEKYFECMYQLLPHIDFYERLQRDPEIWFFQIVLGMENFKIQDIVRHLNDGDWEIRQGLHAMTYGKSLENKVKFIDDLSRKQSTNIVSGDLDIGSIALQAMDTIQEASSSIARAAVYSYLWVTQGDLDNEAIEKVARTTVAMEDARMSDIQDVMQQYTHNDWFEKYDELIQNKRILALFEKYDQRISMLDSIEIDSIRYDLYVSGMIQKYQFGKKADELEEIKSPEDVRHKMNMIAEIVKGQ